MPQAAHTRNASRTIEGVETRKGVGMRNDVVMLKGVGMLKTIAVAGVLSLTATTAVSAWHFGRAYWHPLYLKVAGTRTVAEVVARYGPAAEERLEPYFDRARVAYPPREVLLLGLKEPRQLEVWARSSGPWRMIRSYEIRAASGTRGPKLREGDLQVPEGVYRILHLNPNSAYHLSMKIDYPNAFDREKARSERRTRLGGDIFIHGKAVSIGCLAMGDPAIEELFTLVHRTGTSRVKVVIAPTDPRQGTLEPLQSSPPWTRELYRRIEQTLAQSVLAGSDPTPP